MIQLDDVPVPAANAVFREEFDDWGLLFDPDSGEVHGANPVAAFVWKQIDGHRSVRETISLVRASFENVPDSVEEEVLKFVEKLREKGFLAEEAG